LPESAALQLARRAPLRCLLADATLAPLPIHASYREDPTSSLTESVLDSAQAYLSNSPTSGGAPAPVEPAA